MKTCRVCGKEKELEEFVKNNRRADGYDSRCLECDRMYKYGKMKEREEEIKAHRKEYREQNAEIIKLRKQQDYTNRREAVLAHNKEYYETHKDQILAQIKQYRIRNADRKRQWDKDYARNNRKRIRAYKRKYYALNKDNEAFRIRMRLSGRIVQALRGVSKSEPTMHLLGCSIEELQEYLSSKFQEGMSWDNYGLDGWHVDHIRPCASFDLADPEQQKVCFHYSNLQPLWAVDNMSKGSLWQGARRYRSKRKN